jgi:hypothetical protein
MSVQEKYDHIKLMPFQWEPFNGDRHLENQIKAICKKHGIQKIIELGTCLGSSTIWFAQNFDYVQTSEINPEFAAIAESRFKESRLDNIALWVEDSRSILPIMIPYDTPTFIFIDSHWGPSNPLIQELAIIERSGNKNLVICIHDFKVPGRPELGFDTYPEQGIVYEWEWIEPSISRIYPDGYTVTYNSEATGAKRGVILIEPKKLAQK